MSVPAFESNHDIFASLEGEEVLRLAREAIVQLGYDRLDEAMALEAEEQRVYIMDAVIDIPEEEALAVMLTRDGERPYKDEASDKEQIILYFIASSTEKLWIEHIKEGEHSRFTLDSESLSYQDDTVDVPQDMPHLQLEPTEEDILFVVNVEHPVSDMARLSLLREKIERFQLTPQQ